jgi:hypothetical protein
MRVRPAFRLLKFTHMATIYLTNRTGGLQTVLTQGDVIDQINACKKHGEMFLRVIVIHSFAAEGCVIQSTSEPYYIAIDHIQYITP